jgi:hypothetical protein
MIYRFVNNLNRCGPDQLDINIVDNESGIETILLGNIIDTAHADDIFNAETRLQFLKKNYKDRYLSGPNEPQCLKRYFYTDKLAASYGDFELLGPKKAEKLRKTVVTDEKIGGLTSKIHSPKNSKVTTFLDGLFATKKLSPKILTAYNKRVRQYAKNGRKYFVCCHKYLEQPIKIEHEFDFTSWILAPGKWVINFDEKKCYRDW